MGQPQCWQQGNGIACVFLLRVLAAYCHCVLTPCTRVLRLRTAYYVLMRTEYWYSLGLANASGSLLDTSPLNDNKIAGYCTTVLKYFIATSIMDTYVNMS